MTTSDPTKPRRYFKGPMMQAPAAWKEAVKDAMAKRGMSRTELADAIGAEKSAITRLFSPAVTVSRMVRSISALLDVPEPVIGVDMDASDIIELVGKLSDDDKARVVDFVKRLAKDE